MAGLKQWWRGVRPYVLSGPIAFLVKMVGNTLRIETDGLDRVQSLGKGVILSGWHGRTFLATRTFRGAGLWTIISLSRDGEMQDRIFRSFGFNTIRGSTGRGGAKAAIESIRVLKEGGIMAFTPDGPRGPSGIVQGGMLLMAKKSGAALVPVGVSASRRWLAPTWDKFMVPLPFSRGVMIFGEPLYLDAAATEEDVEAVRLKLESEMHRLQAEAEKRMGHPSQ
jgi:lysophospholipid acyltransferase (LPLAT)-like uncharacterized protein